MLMQRHYALLILGILGLLFNTAFAQNNNYWLPTAPGLPENSQRYLSVLPSEYQIAELDVAEMEIQLRTEFAGQLADFQRPVLIQVPTPEGDFEVFSIWPTDVVDASVRQLVTVQTFQGVAKSDPTKLIRCDVSSTGFHAFVF